MSAYTEILTAILELQERLESQVTVELLDEYTTMRSRLKPELLGSRGLTCHDADLLLAAFPSSRAHEYFVHALFSARHDLSIGDLELLLGRFPKPVLSSTNVAFLRMSTGFKSASHYLSILRWVQETGSEGEIEKSLQRELVSLYLQYSDKGRGDFPEPIIKAISDCYSDQKQLKEFHQWYQRIRCGHRFDSCLLKHPDRLVRDAGFIQSEKVAQGSYCDSGPSIKPGYLLSRALVEPLTQLTEKPWPILSVMTLVAFKVSDFAELEITSTSTEPFKVLYAFTRKVGERAKAIAELEPGTLVQCLAAHPVFGQACHLALGKADEATSKKLVALMIDALLITARWHPSVQEAHDIAGIYRSTLTGLGEQHLHMLKAMKYETYSGLADDESIIKEAAPEFWSAFTAFRGWSNRKVRDLVFSEDLGL